MHVFDEFTFQPLTSANWRDFVTLFEEHGVQNGCWCMYWRIRRQDFQRNYGEGNKHLMQQVIESGKAPGILAYLDSTPIGWCAIAPRTDFSVLERSPTLKRVDDQPVWSITCFFISKPFRRVGMTDIMLRAALAYARQQGASIVEAYPLKTEMVKQLPYERFMGSESTFKRNGFKVVARRSERRPIMRYHFQTSKTKGTK